MRVDGRDPEVRVAEPAPDDGERDALAGGGAGAQCTELAAMLARRLLTHTVIFGGDVNRLRPCAPPRPLDPRRRAGRPGPQPPASVRKHRTPLALGAGAAGHAHRPRRP